MNTHFRYRDRFDAMAWALPLNSWNQVDKAGKALAREKDDEKLANAFSIVQNWRAAHQFPLNTFQVTLRRKSAKISKGSIVSQRIKRIESIERKLKSGTMQLSQMQDIGGCRSVVGSIKQVKALRQLYADSEFDHTLRVEKDYIDLPKNDGYRSLHLVYRYKGHGATAC